MDFTLALIEASAQCDAASVAIKAAADKDTLIISGTKLFVPDAHIADYLLRVIELMNKYKLKSRAMIP